MKRILFSISFIFSFYFSNAQDLKLKNEFTQQRLNDESKLDSYFSKSTSRYSQKQRDSLKQNLAGFAGKIPLFYTMEETRANATANMDELQSGTVSGITSPVTGSGIKITVFDAGLVTANHEQFTTGRAINNENPALQDPPSSGGTTVAISSHTNNVNSVLIANGSGTGNAAGFPKSYAKGVLPLGTTDNYMFAFTKPLGNQYEKLATLPNLNISNHSYGVNVGWQLSGGAYYWVGAYGLNAQDTYSGAYAERDYNFDKIVYTQPNQIIVKSTGNYYGVGPLANSAKYKFDDATQSWIPFAANDVIPPANCSQGYNCIGYGSLAKNIITVGAVNQLTTQGNKYTTATDVVKGSFSSAGPRKDGAVKPDLTAVGVDMFMANSGTSNYTVTFGTSFAAPMVSGIAGALTQIERNISGNSSFIFNVDEMKALLTHTANEAGRPGPDVWYGWGLVDAKKAAQVLVNRLDEDAYLEKQTLTSGQPFTKQIKATGTEPLKVSISWVDPAITPFTSDTDLQNNHTSRIVNDLDLRVVEVGTGTIYYPWRLDINDPNANATKGDNTVDNVEQIVIDNPTTNGIYRIEVNNKNALVNQEGNTATQNFALVATGTKKITLAANDSSKQEVKIYPTKTKDIINVNAPNDIERIALFDMNGKLILENTKTSKVQAISLNKFTSGVYIITVKTKSGTISKKIIKE
ncbi:S8 family peptidase [Epilithonimonas zeae]|uniref:S8 family peptidase n=1 Tax=Epilithonimonas zeae TaxID=1416779 RepID=UPI00200E8639|nr:S8 family peptidase [Epilithonimonas zeae]UQB67262.1 S8 family peptidase [Epilithonimonas zeae]